ncbi:MAG: hypothetical protein Kow0090_11450 [Myxococcota bacterium]
MSELGISEKRREDVFRKPKTYGLMALAEGKSPAIDKGPEDTVMTYPTVIIAELTVFMATFAAMLLLSMLFDAPLKEIANPNVPENPAKAPWYFLGLQELVSYSAFMGGIAIPTIVLIGLALIPYLDRERGHIGVWFSGAQGKRVAFQTFIFSFIFIVSIVAFTVKFGWLRNWFPNIPQLAIIVFNPGTIIVGGVVAWSLLVIKTTGSKRMGAIAVFTFFIVGFIILTYVGVYLRGPNWGFYWSSSQWPGIH